MSKKSTTSHAEEHAKNELEKALKRQRIIDETTEDLTNNAKYKELFEQYSASSVESFIKHYANQKASWELYGELYRKLEEKRAVKPRKEAEEYLGLIIQKKMFNQQCLWRAGKIELEGVESIYDFHAWEKDWKRCPFIEPITREEWEIFKKALEAEHTFEMGPLYDSDNFFMRMMFKFQGYDEFKEYYISHGGENPFPEWYNFYDMYMGTSKLFLLDDMRGPQELKYFWIGHDYMYPDQKVLEKRPEVLEGVVRKLTPPPAPEQPKQIEKPLPFMQQSDRDIFNFMKMFNEDPEVLQLGEYFMSEQRRMESEWDTTEIVDFLLAQDDIIPVSKSWDWAEALHTAKLDYEQKLRMAVIDDVYEEYCMRIENHIPLRTSQNYLTYADMARKFANDYKQKVLTGRKVLGEPEDFSFNKLHHE